MAIDGDVRGRPPGAAALSSDGDNSDGEGGSPASGSNSQVEWLATGRARRATAGNRMKSMIAQEVAAAGLGRGADSDSDLELLFAEADDDEGFTDDGERADASDAHMDSSSDDEDDAPGGADNELEGEKELERVAREKRAVARKRKAQEAIPAKFRKRVRIDSTPSTTPARGSETPTGRLPQRQRQEHQPRPKKKSERTSWLPTAADMPTRASERSTTRMSKEQLHQQMVEREVRRKKQLEMQEKKAKRLEALKKPPMTQADRLREAALVEKRNSKSLNRWEEAEKQREEERERKLAALYSRTLEGPVFTFWSGIMELSEGQMKHVGRMVAMEEKAPRKKRQSAAAGAAVAAPATADAPAPGASVEPSGTEKSGDKPGQSSADENPSQAPTTTGSPPAPQPRISAQQISPPAGDEAAPEPGLAAPAFHEAVFRPIGLTETPTSEAPPTAEPKPVSSSVLAPPLSVLAPPLGTSPGPMQMPGFNTAPSPMGTSTVLALPNTSHGPPLASVPLVDAPSPSILSVPPPETAPTPVPITAEKAPSPPAPQPPKVATASKRSKQASAPKASGSEQPVRDPEPEPPLDGKVTRSCIILQNFDQEAIKDKTVQTQILFGRKMTKLAKPGHTPHCVITGHVARYKDPKTGLPFANMNAYKQIRRLTQGDYKWSSLLGLWVGTGDVAAKGVPNRFLKDGPKEESPPPEPTPAAAALPVPAAAASAAPAVPLTPQAPANLPNVATGTGATPRKTSSQAPATTPTPAPAVARPVACAVPPPVATHRPFTSSALAAPATSIPAATRPGPSVIPLGGSPASHPPPPPPPPRPRPPSLAPVATPGVRDSTNVQASTNSVFAPPLALVPAAAPLSVTPTPASVPPAVGRGPPPLKTPASHDAHTNPGPPPSIPTPGPLAKVLLAATPVPAAPPVPTAAASVALAPGAGPDQDVQGGQPTPP